MSLPQRFLALLFLFVSTTAAVLYLLVAAKNEPIDFAKQEIKGNTYQKPLEKALMGLMQHRILAQRISFDENGSSSQIPEIQKLIDSALKEVESTDLAIGESLQFTEVGLKSRKRDHFKISTITKEWSDLKSKLSSLKTAESNELHAHLIADIRAMITHLGDTSNLILDPDLDSYYLMDITLLALPQTQDRIQNVIVEIEPIIRKKQITLEDQIKASVFVSMMSESDLERVKADYQTVLNEDSNFYGKSASLEPKLSAAHKKFESSYKELIDLVNGVASGKLESEEKFLQVSQRALDESFAYWNVSVVELDSLLENRANIIQKSKNQASVISLFALLLSLGIAWLFIRYLVKNMRSIVSILRNSSQEVSSASNRSASFASELSEATTEQASSLQETMASAEEISAMVSQNAESASKTKSAVDTNQKVSEDGSKSVNEMMNAISEIKQTNDEILKQMESSNKEFAEIVKIISEIGTKTNVINEIVFQTKLLSFNASVEAARAGEHGKGFAVVAEEVGNLAQMSGNAAKEITDMLSDSIKKVNAIVEHTKDQVDHIIEVGKDKITMGQSTAQKCKQALNEITENARSVASMISEITNASKEQAQGVQEINKAISQLDQITQQNSTVAQQSSTQAEHLNSEANSLSNAVDQLVLFLEGANDSKSHSNHGEFEQSQASGKIVSISPKKKSQRPSVDRTTGSMKKAVGSSALPSSDDPQFEEF
jgi:methyl-accepting chemotaxis protein